MYFCVANPTTDAEIEFECSGLELVICEIKSRIAKLRQAQQLRAMMEASNEQL